MRLDLSNGPPVADPDDRTVQNALRNVAEGEEYAILVDDEKGEQHFIQVAKESKGFVVEYREGEKQYRSNLLPLETVTKVFQAYRKQDKSRKEGVSWTDITEEIGDKGGCRAKAVLVAVMVSLGAWATFSFLI
ncbi:hypothetical protein AYO44_06980 [Planctomycetaceae bacterium SCGC AG-212-F19]|nr:hypothetical protein AYO44_06980 [Planctomycetaceae bacterium SCGC AG-212-F19]